jgi:hypothetical protein
LKRGHARVGLSSGGRGGCLLRLILEARWGLCAQGGPAARAGLLQGEERGSGGTDRNLTMLAAADDGGGYGGGDGG